MILMPDIKIFKNIIIKVLNFFAIYYISLWMSSNIKYFIKEQKIIYLKIVHEMCYDECWITLHYFL